MSDSSQPHGLQPARLLCPWDSPGKNTGVGCHALLGDLPNPGIEPRSLTMQKDSLPSEPPEKLKNTGVGSLSLLQWIFPTQKSNWGLLHCRRTLYQLSSQGSPKIDLGLMPIPGDPKCSLVKWTVRVFLKTNFICLFLAMPGLRCSVWAFSGCGE